MRVPDAGEHATLPNAFRVIRYSWTWTNSIAVGDRPTRMMTQLYGFHNNNNILERLSLTADRPRFEDHECGFQKKWPERTNRGKNRKTTKKPPNCRSNRDYENECPFCGHRRRRRSNGQGGQGCKMAKFDPFLSLDCARVEGVGAQSKERKGSNFAA